MSAWRAVVAYLGLFFGGGAVGSQLARAVAPTSDLAELVSFVAFPAAFMAGIIAWAGAALPAVFRGFMRLLAMRGEPRPVASNDAVAVVMPGSVAFLPVAVVVVGAAGLVVALLSRTQSFVAVLGIYILIGAGYGALCWRLARSGWLPFPRE